MDSHDPDKLVGSSSSVTLDHRAQTLTFEHSGSVATDKQKALSPLVVPLGTVAEVHATPGRSTNWFWVVLRGTDPWRKGVWCDPHGVVCGVNPTDFAERVRSAVARATPADAEPIPATPEPSRRSRFGKGMGRALVDGFFNTR